MEDLTSSCVDFGAIATFGTLQSTEFMSVDRKDVIELKVPGFSDTDVVWKKDGEPIDFSTGHYQVLRDGSLQINNPKQSDRGQYTVSIPKLDLVETPAQITDVKVIGMFRPFIYCKVI